MNALALALILAASPLALRAGCCCEPAKPAKAASAPEVPAAGSIYEQDATWIDSTGNPFRLGSLAGRPVVITMGFASCKYACPRMMADLAALEAKLSPDERAQLHFVFVSIDPERDTPEALGRFLAEHKVDTTRWHAMAGSQADTRELSVALGIRYRVTPGGQFAHSNIMVLLDAKGGVAATLEGLGADPAPLLAALRKLSAAPVPATPPTPDNR